MKTPIEHEQIRRYKKHVQRRLTVTIITPAIIHMDNEQPVVTKLSPIRVIGGLTDTEIFAEIKKHHRENNVYPYQVEKHSELYVMTLDHFVNHAELKKSTKINLN